jgi:predicted amidophosphoribosyltransferase
VSWGGELEIQRAGCYLCGRPTFDPDKRSRPWVRAVSSGRQVLVCPSCQAEREDWMAGLDHCERCGATRLSAMLGEVVCRACGHVRTAADASQD